MAETSAIFGDIIVILDISGSMEDEISWISDAFTTLEESLIAGGIGPNKYGLVTYGSRPTGGDPTVELTGVDLEEFVSTMSGITVSGGRETEDGYDAITVALDNYQFRAGSSRICMLITDEDRDRVDRAVSKDSVISKLLDNSTNFNAIVNATFTNDAIGVRSDRVGFFDDGSGGFTTQEDQSVLSGLGSTVADYVDLAWQMGGAAYNLDILRVGGTAATAFTAAFIDNKVTEITQGVDPPTSNLCNFTLDPGIDSFLCESDEEDEPIVEIFNTGTGDGEFFDFLTSEGRNVCVHFRVSVFTDPQRNSLLYSAFSLTDQRRWFNRRTDLPPCQVPLAGLVTSSTDIPDVIYLPEILPAVLIEQQLQSEISGSTVERPLLCGATYYLTIEAYVVDTFYLIKKSSFRIPCRNVKQSFWRDNFDAKNWISSGQGKSDFRISKTSNEALFSNVTANGYGNFAVAWQDHRNNAVGGISQTPDVFYGIWETGRNLFWMSGQGRADTKAVPTSFRPLVFPDAGRNFVFSGRSPDEIKINRCPQPIPDDEAAVVCAFSDDEEFDIDNVNRDADAYLKARVYGPDVKSSYVIAEDDVVSVVDDCVVRFDIVGAPGTYAVRARSEDDASWSSWINIDEALPTQSNVASSSSASSPEGDVFSAYFIDNDRFILPWVVPAGSGVRRVCFQILTYFGITKAFCLDVFANIAEIDYKVEFSYAQDFSEEVATFESLPAIKHNTETEEGQDNSTTTVHIRVTFDDPKRIAKFQEMAQSDKFFHLFNGDDKLTFNFIQQGVNDQYGLDLEGSEGVYTGSFVIQKSDGVFNKDGLCAIVVNVPNPCTKLKDVICAGSDPDALNPNKANLLQDFYTDYSALDNISAGNIDTALQSSKLARLTDVKSFKQLYSADDSRFTFGNPKFFIKK